VCGSEQHRTVCAPLCTSGMLTVLPVVYIRHAHCSPFMVFCAPYGGTLLTVVHIRAESVIHRCAHPSRECYSPLCTLGRSRQGELSTLCTHRAGIGGGRINNINHTSGEQGGRINNINPHLRGAGREIYNINPHLRGAGRVY